MYDLNKYDDDNGMEFGESEFGDEDDAYSWDYADICYECTGYGDDYYINDEGELECACDTCPFSPSFNADDY